MGSTRCATWMTLALVFAVGCGPSRVEPLPFKFLGIAADETSNEGPTGLVGGQAVQVASVSKVHEAPWSEYESAKKDSRIVAEATHDGYVYWAVKEERDVPFENATAWVTVVERYKSRRE